MAEGTFRGTRAQLLQRLAALPGMLAGSQPDPERQAEQILKALGVRMLSIIKDAYVTKARGGTDAAGIAWKPLDPKYIAYRRRHPGLARKRSYAASKGRGQRPLLTAAQDKRWRQVYAQSLARLKRQQRAGAEGNAAAIAWAVVKREGGKTILGEYGGTSVEIGRDTGRLLASLSPGAPDNVLATGPGEVRVGTAVKYAEGFHSLRPIWPDDAARFPKEWQDALGETLELALAQLVERALRAGG